MTREKFIKLLEEEQEGLMRFLLALCGGNYADAEDLAQETALKAYLSYNGFVERFRFSTWLYRIAYNSFIDYRRKRHIDTAPIESAGSACIDDRQPQQYEDLYRALEGLPPNEKAEMLLFYMEDLKIIDIALILKKPIGTVKSYLSRGRQHLKSILSNE